jgi:hypothetical protein
VGSIEKYRKYKGMLLLRMVMVETHLNKPPVCIVEKPLADVRGGGVEPTPPILRNFFSSREGWFICNESPVYSHDMSVKCYAAW